MIVGGIIMLAAVVIAYVVGNVLGYREGSRDCGELAGRHLREGFDEAYALGLEHGRMRQRCGVSESAIRGESIG